MKLALTRALVFAAFIGVSPVASAQPSPRVLTPLHPVIYEMDTLRTGPLTPELLKQLEPLHTLQAVEELLKANLMPFAWAHTQVSAGALPSQFTRQIDAMPPHEVFVVKQGEGWLIGVVLGTR